MCFGMGGSATVTEKKPKFSNAPPVVTGKQTGVDNPKDTKKATESLMIKRQKEEGTYRPKPTKPSYNYSTYW